jgi:cystathionine beta-lyase
MFAYASTAAAYRQGEDWLNQLLQYIQKNIDFTDDFLKNEIPSISMIRPQASFLIFLNCKNLNLVQKDLEQLFLNKAHLALNSGTMFGTEGEGFMRLNVGCPHATLQKALEQLKSALR